VVLIALLSPVMYAELRHVALTDLRSMIIGVINLANNYRSK